MNLNEYQQAATRTAPKPGMQHAFPEIANTSTLREDKTIDLLHAALGLAGEAGEVVEHVKKAMYYGKPLDEAKLKEEAGDLLWYIAAPLCRALGCTLDELASANVAKLRKRYPEKYTDCDAIARVDMRVPHPGNPPRPGLKATVRDSWDKLMILDKYRQKYGAANVEDGCYFDDEDHAWFPIPELWEEAKPTDEPNLPC
jgi:NTP pyrophosphatase (non-canonical NTP hydrolase)